MSLLKGLLKDVFIMDNKNKLLVQTVSIFVVLAILTLIFVFGFSFVFFGGEYSPAIPASR